MRGYNQFCPVAKAAEIFAERWTPLILRELLMGSRRFSEIEAGIPRISKSLLTQRLRALEHAGLLEHRMVGRVSEYHLTPAGQELYDVVMLLGSWGQRWVNHEIGEQDTDPDLLLWDMHRRIHLDRLPERRVVVQFDFTGQYTRRYWLVLDNREASVCYSDVGFDPDLFVTADTLALHRVWVGHLSLAQALREGLVRLDGPSELTRAFPDWFQFSVFAHIQPVQATTGTAAV